MTKVFASLINIKKSYQQQILNIEKFEILQGECTIITGNNGSGKSTLLKIISGLVDADGSINFQQQKFAIKKNHLLSKKSIYLPSKPYLFDCNVRNNISYPLLLQGMLNNKKCVDEALEWADLTNLQYRHSANLSSGEKQRISLARAYIINPNIWLLDEPTEHLDIAAKKRFYQLLKKLLANNCSIIIVTHSEEIAQQIPHQHLQLIQQQLKKCQ